MNARGRVVLAVVGGWLLAGCMSMPTTGPVTEVDDPGVEQVDAPADIVVRPPQPGESARDIVVHFLEAMEASPISTTVAREFLSEQAEAAWNPELGTVVYATKSSPVGNAVVSITLEGAARLDARGSWRGPMSEAGSTLRFPMVREDGEWRISEAPNALIVRDSWFAQRFRQVSVFFFDPAGEVLVPEQVYLPTGDQLPTYLVRDLIAGPGTQLAGVVRGFFPAGATARPVTVDERGRAAVALQGDRSQLTPRASELMLAQLTWTLRQVPGIRFVDVTVEDEPLRLPQGTTTTEIPIDRGSEFDPSGTSASSVPLALRDGLLVAGPLDDPQPVSGPFGRLDLGLRTVAVDPRSVGVAGVSIDGERLLVASLHDAESDTVQEVVNDATDLLPPSWDLAGRLWLVDRRAGGALVSVVEGDRVRQVDIAGITGREVTSFVVSRDGTRFVAVVRGPERDLIMQSRVRVGDRGVVDGATARRLGFEDQLATRVRDLSWGSATSLLVLSPLTSGINEVRALSVDGSAASGLPAGTTVRGNFQWLAGSPVTGEPWYAVSRRPPRVVDAAGVDYSGGLDGVDLRTLTYPG